MFALVSSAAAAAEFHSLSPPCDHSAATPGPLMPHPGAFAFGRFNHHGFSSGCCTASVENPRMFSVSYQRYSGRGDGETGGPLDDACESVVDARIRSRTISASTETTAGREAGLWKSAMNKKQRGGCATRCAERLCLSVRMP